MKKFNAKLEVKNIVDFIKKYYKDNNLGGAILGISGGKDSGVVAGLLVKALGKENVIGVTLPCHSKEEDRIDAKLVSDYYGIELINFDITSTFDAFKDELKNLGTFLTTIFIYRTPFYLIFSLASKPNKSNSYNNNSQSK